MADNIKHELFNRLSHKQQITSACSLASHNHKITTRTSLTNTTDHCFFYSDEYSCIFVEIEREWMPWTSVSIHELRNTIGKIGHWVHLVIDHPWHNTYLLLDVFFSCLKISDIAFSAIGRVAFPKGELEKDKQNRYVALLIGAIDLSELG